MIFHVTVYYSGNHFQMTTLQNTQVTNQKWTRDQSQERENAAAVNLHQRGKIAGFVLLDKR